MFKRKSQMELVWNGIFKNFKALYLNCVFQVTLYVEHIWHKILKYYMKGKDLFLLQTKKKGYSFWLFAETIIKQNMKINYVMNWNKSDWKLIKKLINFEVPPGKCMNGKTGKKKKNQEVYVIFYCSLFEAYRFFFSF